MRMVKWRKIGETKGRGHWTFCYTSPQRFIIHLFSRWLNHYGDFNLILFGWFIECSNVSTTNCNLQKGSFCISSLGDVLCTSIYRTLSYPYKSLPFSVFFVHKESKLSKINQ